MPNKGIHLLLLCLCFFDEPKITICLSDARCLLVVLNKSLGRISPKKNLPLETSTIPKIHLVIVVDCCLPSCACACASQWGMLALLEFCLKCFLDRVRSVRGFMS